MSDSHNQDNHPSVERPVLKKEMSRRQFLTYTLGGTGGFMAALPLIPMIRFAVDPLLQAKSTGDWVKVVEESKITSTPQEFKFSRLQIDGWYSSEPEFSAWISKGNDGKIFALSPVCKHLGCMILWEGDAKHPGEYSCPCHGARYTKDGKYIVVASESLDEYELRIDNGFIYLNTLKPNSRV